MPRDRARILVGVSAAAFLGPFTQTVYTPSLPELGQDFGVSIVLVNLTISLFTAILAVSSSSWDRSRIPVGGGRPSCPVCSFFASAR